MGRRERLACLAHSLGKFEVMVSPNSTGRFIKGVCCVADGGLGFEEGIFY